jgi:4-hydroxybenzoate polyprenyltransferase/SAM-dependent methyltransferase
VAVVGVAGLGHVVNDVFDADQDRRSGRQRAAAGLTRRRRLVLGAALVVAAVAPWLVLPGGPAVWGLLGLELGLFVAYSSPPLRLKERGFLALPTDAAYAYVVPVLLTAATFGAWEGGVLAVSAGLVALLVTWAAATGLRSIAFHQIDDLEADRAAGVRTWAVRAGRRPVERLANGAVVVEVAALAAWLVAAADRVPLLGPLVLGALGWRAFQVRFLRGREQSVERDPRPAHELAYQYLNHTYERWLPVILLGTLAARSTGYLWLLAAHVLLFRNGLVDVLRRDLPGLLGLRFTVAYWLTYRLGRRRVRRGAPRLAAQPAPAGAPDRGRFVYVVCGSAEHIETLHLSLRHLRPRTRQEILVVTDSTRNEIPVSHDRVIDVATPAALDAHQASIWLKTSLHRHVPLDRPTCYLDSDIVAIRGGVDDVFDHYRPPVTFASDRMIRDNGVDRFSPWAMTCACTGFDEVPTCPHLRLALADCFGVEVPGDWLHWNGGVFVFDAGSTAFLDAWHERCLEAFDDPRFQTRDQHTLIATAWASGLADHPRLPAEFNFIVDLGNYHITGYGGGRYAIHPDEEPVDAQFLHLYSNHLHDPSFTLSADVDEVVVRQMARRSADSVRELRALFGPHAVTGRVRRWLSATFWALDRTVQRVLRRVVWPTVDVLRRAGRSLARRGRVLAGREPSPGGRWDALRFPKGWREQPRSTARVAAHFDAHHDRYVEMYGEIFQRLQSHDPEAHLVELGELAGLEAGQRVLDAGCGIGGPAVRFAEKFGVEVDAVTCSGVEVEHARRLVEQRQLTASVQVHHADFHQLEHRFEPGPFDVVCLLESLSCSDHPGVVLASAHRVLKPGGVLLVKDVFRAVGTSSDDEADIAARVARTEAQAPINVRRREEVLHALTAAGFHLEVDRGYEGRPDLTDERAARFEGETADVTSGRYCPHLVFAAIRARKPF